MPGTSVRSRAASSTALRLSVFLFLGADLGHLRDLDAGSHDLFDELVALLGIVLVELRRDRGDFVVCERAALLAVFDEGFDGGVARAGQRRRRRCSPQPRLRGARSSAVSTWRQRLASPPFHVEPEPCKRRGEQIVFLSQWLGHRSTGVRRPFISSSTLESLRSMRCRSKRSSDRAKPSLVLLDRQRRRCERRGGQLCAMWLSPRKRQRINTLRRFPRRVRCNVAEDVATVRRLRIRPRSSRDAASADERRPHEEQLHEFALDRRALRRPRSRRRETAAAHRARRTRRGAAADAAQRGSPRCPVCAPSP